MATTPPTIGPVGFDGSIAAVLSFPDCAECVTEDPGGCCCSLPLKYAVWQNGASEPLKQFISNGPDWRPASGLLIQDGNVPTIGSLYRCTRGGIVVYARCV